MRKPFRTVEERVVDGYAIDQGSGCWIWRGAINRYGYPRVTAGTPRSDNYVQRQAHIVMYEVMVGPIPDGLTLDHTCHNSDPTCAGGVTCRHRRCINPDHLEAVPIRVNVLRGNAPSAINARKTHCKRGHEFTVENTRINPKNGSRTCRTCERVTGAKSKARRRLADMDAGVAS